MTGTVESAQGQTLSVKVISVRGVNANQGATFSAEVGPNVSILREIGLTDLRKGMTVTMRGSVENGKFVVRQVWVEVR